MAQCWSQTLLSDIKLSLVLEEGDVAPEVVLLHHLGLPDEQVVGVGWWDLDRTVRPDHLTSLYVPELPAANGAGRQMAAAGRARAHAARTCPWDRAQTHGSLMPHLVEESYKVLDALGARGRAPAETAHGTGGDAAAPGHLQEELGDLLFQIVFHAQLAHEADALRPGRCCPGRARQAGAPAPSRLRRHAGVHARAGGRQLGGDKKEEKGRASVTEGIPRDLPALLLSTKLQRKALSVRMADLHLQVGGTAFPKGSRLWRASGRPPRG